jgi:hypothetical protein
MTGMAHDVVTLAPDKYKGWMGPTSGPAIALLYSHNLLLS